MAHTKPIPCFRGGIAPPALDTLEKELAATQRIQCRKPWRNPPPKATILFGNERKIERVLRSKSGWDAIFELCPMSPWRETSQLWAQPKGTTKILHLDFKNFYPSILCAFQFPHPAKLFLCKNIGPAERLLPGLFRCILHAKEGIPEQVKTHHPFTISSRQRSLPFAITTRPIETFLHAQEMNIWEKWFDIEISEALLSEPIKHPLARRTERAIRALEAQNLSPEARAQEKLRINMAYTTPKIASPRDEPSPFGVHCLPSTIASLGRAMLCETAHCALNAHPSNQLLCTNTDGILLKSDEPEVTLEYLRTLGILGENPGQLRLKSCGDEAIILGPNFWWLLEAGHLVDATGQGHSQEPVPLHHRYGPTGEFKILTIHLADYRHRLNHEALTRSKFEAPEDPLQIPEILRKEKERSLGITLHHLRGLRKRLATDESKIQSV